MQTKKYTEHRVNTHQAGDPRQKQYLPAKAIDGKQSHKLEHQADRAGDHDVEQYVGDLEPAAAKISCA